MRSTTQRLGLARLITASPALACITILATMPRTFSIPTAIASRRSTRVGSTLRHNAFEFQGGVIASSSVRDGLVVPAIHILRVALKTPILLAILREEDATDGHVFAHLLGCLLFSFHIRSI